jgi:2-deoxy-D-gluconate 3-dehydrogenase
VLAVNLDAPFRLARAVGARMVRRGRGKIVFTASMLSYQGGVNVPGYTASKSAIAGVTRALANEWARRGVNVNAIAPGYIATDNTQAL